MIAQPSPFAGGQGPGGQGPAAWPRRPEPGGMPGGMQPSELAGPGGYRRGRSPQQKTIVAGMAPPIGGPA